MFSIFLNLSSIMVVYWYAFYSRSITHYIHLTFGLIYLYFGTIYAIIGYLMINKVKTFFEDYYNKYYKLIIVSIIALTIPLYVRVILEFSFQITDTWTSNFVDNHYLFMNILFLLIECLPIFM